MVAYNPEQKPDTFGLTEDEKNYALHGLGKILGHDGEFVPPLDKSDPAQVAYYALLDTRVEWLVIGEQGVCPTPCGTPENPMSIVEQVLRGMTMAHDMIPMYRHEEEYEDEVTTNAIEQLTQILQFPDRALDDLYKATP